MAPARGTSITKPQTIALYGTVMGTRQEGAYTMHRIEATGPDGNSLALQVAHKKRHRGAVRIKWDPSGQDEPSFVVKAPMAMLPVALVIVVVIVLGGWLLFG